MSGQLSSSKMVSESVAQAPDPTCRTPSSVIISQCDRLCSRHRHTCRTRLVMSPAFGLNVQRAIKCTKSWLHHKSVHCCISKIPVLKTRPAFYTVVYRFKCRTCMQCCYCIAATCRVNKNLTLGWPSLQ